MMGQNICKFVFLRYKLSSLKIEAQEKLYSLRYILEGTSQYPNTSNYSRNVSISLHEVDQ